MPDERQTFENTSIHKLVEIGDMVHILDKRLNPSRLELKIISSQDSDEVSEQVVDAQHWDTFAQPKFRFKKIGCGMAFIRKRTGLTQVNAL